MAVDIEVAGLPGRGMGDEGAGLESHLGDVADEDRAPAWGPPLPAIADPFPVVVPNSAGPVPAVSPLSAGELLAPLVIVPVTAAPRPSVWLRIAGSVLVALVIAALMA